MLLRKDKKRVPLGFIPNGSGNIDAEILKHETVEKALDYIIKGDIVKIDAMKVIIDHERDEDVPEEEKFSYIRYGLALVSFGISGKVSEKSV